MSPQDKLSITILAGMALQIITVVWLGRSLRRSRDLEELITHSPRICFTCRRFEMGHEQISAWEDDGHNFVPSYLVYVPSPSVEQYWPTPPSADLR